MKNVISVVAIIVLMFMVGACSMDNIRYSGHIDEVIQTAPCAVVVETVEEAVVVIEEAKVVEAAAPVEIVKNVIKIKQPIMFPFDSAVITDEEMVKIDTLANLLNENPDTVVVVNGWASSEGSDEYNMALSGDRATAVKSELIAKGIDEDRVSIVAKGETGLFGDILKLNRRAIVLDVE